MYFFFEVLKGIFFFLTMIIGLLFLRGDKIIGDSYIIVKQIMMPGYLIFCGLMLGYIIARIWMGNNDEHPQQKEIYIKSFIIGISIGILLSIFYIVL